jgi:hypothetical protein
MAVREIDALHEEYLATNSRYALASFLETPG